MTRTAFERIELSEESKVAYDLAEMGRQRAELEATNQRAVASGADTMSIKRMEARIQAREEKLKEKADRATDPGITFEQTGIDYLLVDELHEYKNSTPPRTFRTLRSMGPSGPATCIPRWSTCALCTGIG
ncbi:hypothetical protein [Kocuria nitroreducens]|uniref:hypothetical protein n=1 Tax=Kocuria nitroreducens TaxID=3058914 RepID=UPI0036DE5EF6